MIDRYATSEEIIATLGDPEIAEAVSFAGLEGLTRSIISGYDDKSQWLTNNLELKHKKRKGGERAGIVDALEMVLNREMATESPNLDQTLTELAKLRNSTMHTDLRSDPDQANAYHRWNASQALIEALLLNKMGLERIPNRTATQLSPLWVWMCTKTSARKPFCRTNAKAAENGRGRSATTDVTKTFAANAGNTTTRLGVLSPYIRLRSDHNVEPRGNLHGRQTARYAVLS